MTNKPSSPFLLLVISLDEHPCFSVFPSTFVRPLYLSTLPPRAASHRNLAGRYTNANHSHNGSSGSQIMTFTPH